MRQFILGNELTYGALIENKTLANDGILALQEGAVGFIYEADNVLTLSSNGADLPRMFNLVLGRTDENGGPLVFPVCKDNFSFVKGTYQEATTFVATVTVPAPTKIGDYTIIVAKKGVKFNERNKWTASVHVRDTTMTANTLASKIADAINDNAGHGCNATVENAVITITSQTAGIDYTVIPADELYGTQSVVTTKGAPAYGDAKYVQDLAEKAAADAGFEYTFRDAYTYLYPNYPLNPLKGTQAADKGFTIFTLRFNEPRNVKTRDEVVNQIIQVAFPTESWAISTFEDICEAIIG